MVYKLTVLFPLGPPSRGEPIYIYIHTYICVYICICLRVENRTSVLHVFIMGSTGWGGVGWGDNVHLHFVTYMMLHYCASHIWCYVTMWDGVGWDGVIAFICTSLTYMMLRYCASHIWCYVTVPHTWGGVGWGAVITFIGLHFPHINDATLL